MGGGGNAVLNELMMRWFTCTPVAFGGGADFFARDSGLLCRGLQANGVDCLAVMPLPSGADDGDDLLRVDASKLSSSEWWAAQNLDGVVLYAWGSPRYLPVARAIRQAGIFLVLNQDNGGLVSSLIDLDEWCREQMVIAGAGRTPGGAFRGAMSLLKGLLIGRLIQDRRRAKHLMQGDVIACVSPEAAEHHRAFCRHFGGDELAKRVVVLPHAVDPRYRPVVGVEKEARVVVVGRWDDEIQKRPELLVQGVERLLELEPGVEVQIVGGGIERLQKWHGGLPGAVQRRILLEGRGLPEVLAGILAKAQVSWCPSAFESFHIASGEALCRGASVVAGDSPSLASFRWFVGDGDGCLAKEDDVDGHVEAIRSELKAWRKGKRNAALISRRWSGRLHAPAVAGRILELKRKLSLKDQDV